MATDRLQTILLRHAQALEQIRDALQARGLLAYAQLADRLRAECRELVVELYEVTPAFGLAEDDVPTTPR